MAVVGCIALAAAGEASPGIDALFAAATNPATRERQIRPRAIAALWGLFVGDSIGMPTMWFYRPPRDIVNAFGARGLTGFANPPATHETNSLMADFWAANREHVREVVGTHMLHDKAQLWQRRNVHYHSGLLAGDNTLNAELLRVLLQTVTAAGGVYNTSSYLQAYASFLTTPGSHNDSYADTAHIQVRLT